MGSQYHTGWITRKFAIGEQVDALDYHSRTGSYVIGTCSNTDYRLSDEETWAAEGEQKRPKVLATLTAHIDTTLSPQVEQGCIRLLDRKTWSFIDRYRNLPHDRPDTDSLCSRHDLDAGEVVMSIKTMSLEISEHTHERQSLVVVGTAIIRGGDLPAIGRIYVLDIIDVVPEPDHPETGKKLKLIAREEVKGAVTALSEIGTQGFLLAAQGQKCMVRGLKEDGSLLPVAFMDMQCYVSAAKELKGTGLCVMGDAIKGIWFAGYTEDPYQLRVFGKSSKHIEVLAADFLPDGKQLYVVAADADCNIHVLQFDPESKVSHHTIQFLPPLPFPYETSASRAIMWLTTTTHRP